MAGLRALAACFTVIITLLSLEAAAQTAQNEEPPREDVAEQAAADNLLEFGTVLYERVAVNDPAELTRRAILTLIVVALALFLRRLASRFSDRFSAGGNDEATPGALSARAAALGFRVRRIFGGLIFLGAVLALLEIWGIGLSGLAPDGRGGIGRIAAVVLIGWALWHVSRIGIESLLLTRSSSESSASAASQRAKTLAPLLSGAARIAIVLIAGLILLSEFGINIAPLLAGAGILGLAVGFGAQSLVKDVLTGIFILLEDSIGVGDVVTVAGHSGLVERMGLRELRLRDIRGTVHIVPYGDIGTIQNLTRDFSFAVLDIGVAYQEDIDRVMAVMLEIAEEQRANAELSEFILEPMEMLGLNEFSDSAIIIRARIKTRPLQQWKIQRDYNLRLKRRFDAEGIEIPFPHRTLYFGADKDGKATAMRMRLIEAQKQSLQREPQDGRDPAES